MTKWAHNTIDVDGDLWFICHIADLNDAIPKSEDLGFTTEHDFLSSMPYGRTDHYLIDDDHLQLVQMHVKLTSDSDDFLLDNKTGNRVDQITTIVNNRSKPPRILKSCQTYLQWFKLRPALTGTMYIGRDLDGRYASIVSHNKFNQYRQRQVLHFDNGKFLPDKTIYEFGAYANDEVGKDLNRSWDKHVAEENAQIDDHND